MLTQFLRVRLSPINTRMWVGTGMDQSSEVEAKRQETKRKILALKEQILFVRIFNQLGKAFKPNSVGYWLAKISSLSGRRP
jgi:hypothetical protein